MSDNGSLYERPIFLSKRQLRKITKGSMITIRRKKHILQLAPKGYTDENAKIKMQIEKLKEKLKKKER
jgi:hypothetical protein